MDNTNKSDDKTSAAPPPISPTPTGDLLASAANTPATTTPAAQTGPIADLGSSFSSTVPAAETPKTDISAEAATPESPASPEPVVAEPTTAGSSVTPPTTIDSTSEAHAGITPPPATPPMSTAESNVTDPGYAKTKSNHMVLITVILVIVAFASVLVLFFYRQYSNLVNPSSSISPTPVAKAVISPTSTPSPTPANEEEKELQSLKIDEIDTELQNIEKDLTQL